MNFAECLRTSPVMLTPDPLDTRLTYEFGLATPDRAIFVHLFHTDGRAALAKLYHSYMAVAAKHDLPMLLGTATWRAHPDVLARHGFNSSDDLRRVNAMAVGFLISGVPLIRTARSSTFWCKAGATAKRLSFFKKRLTGLGDAPRVNLTDKLKSYGAGKREMLPGNIGRTGT